jgi:hypothetical protein
MKRSSRLVAVALSAAIAAVAVRAEGAQTDCELDPSSYDACMYGVNASYQACLNSGGDPLDCQMNQLIAEIACWAQYCLIIPDPGE